jgi:hypothetical protein
MSERVLSEYRRMLARANRHFYDIRQHLHEGLPILRGSIVLDRRS